MYLGKMSSYFLALFLPFFWARTVQTQKSFAACTEDFKWAFNSKDESPCLMAADLMSICWGPGYATYALPTGASYWGPWTGYDSPCVCSSVTWGLFSACGTCQNGSAITWSMWAYNCTNVTVKSFPLAIPQQFIIPHWTYLNVGDDGRWNETAAVADVQNPPSPPHHSHVGAIVGGVIGGVVAVALAIALFLVFRHRRKTTKNPQTTAFGPEGRSPYMPGDVVTQAPISPRLSSQQTNQKLYDPTDPSTFPPPLNYDYSGMVQPGSPESPGNRRTVIY